MEKILVTGGAGFIGTSLINRLLNTKKYHVYNIDKLSYSEKAYGVDEFLKQSLSYKKNYHFFKVDLLDNLSLEKTLNDIKPDKIFHLAAETHVDRSIDNPEKFLSNNVIGTFNLLNSAFKFWKKLSSTKKEHFRFINISTDEVYGSLKGTSKFNELSKYSPRSPYSASKASADHFVKAWFATYGFPAITTNCSNNFGPWQFPDKFIPVIITKALSGENIPIYGNGLNIRDWLYVEDHTRALILISELGEIGESYCIGGSNEICNLDLVKKICNFLDKIKPNTQKYKELISFVEDRPGHDFRYSIDSTKIRNHTGWEPLQNFDLSLNKTINWYVENIDWCYGLKQRKDFSKKRLGISTN